LVAVTAAEELAVSGLTLFFDRELPDSELPDSELLEMILG